MTDVGNIGVKATDGNRSGIGKSRSCLIASSETGARNGTYGDGATEEAGDRGIRATDGNRSGAIEARTRLSAINELLASNSACRQGSFCDAANI